MELTKPSYFDQFRCLAGACPDSCCQEWAVVVDPESAARYAALPGNLGDRLRAAMTEEDGELILTLTPDHRCPMWRRDGLCDIQAALGEEALCDTCRQFPRLRHDYGDFMELGLELSCPEAARLILEGRERTITTQVPGEEEADYDRDAMVILKSSRAQALALLEDPRFTPGQALAILLLYGYAVQNQLDGGEPAQLSPGEDLQRAQSLAGTGDSQAILDFYGTLEILTDRWRSRLEQPLDSPWCEGHRLLARYFVQRYWLQAVSDYDLVSRVKFAVCSCLVIRLLGGNLAETAQLYSKEIENDAGNVDALLDGAYTAPSLIDTALLALLL